MTRRRDGDGSESITQEQCETVALQRYVAGAGWDHAEVDVGCRGRRGHGSPQLGATRPRIVGENRLRCRSLTHRQPIRACADAIPRAVDRALQAITRVRQQVPNPDVHIENVLRRIFLLAELDEPEPVAPQNGLQIEVRLCGIGREVKGGCAALADGSADEDKPPMGASEALGAVGVAPPHATVNAHKPTTRYPAAFPFMTTLLF